MTESPPTELGIRDPQEMWDTIRTYLQGVVDDTPDFLEKFSGSDAIELGVQAFSDLDEATDMTKGEAYILGLWDVYSLCEEETALSKADKSMLQTTITAAFIAQQMYTKGAVV